MKSRQTPKETNTQKQVNKSSGTKKTYNSGLYYHSEKHKSDSEKIKKMMEVEIIPIHKKETSGRIKACSKISTQIFGTTRCKTPKLDQATKSQRKQS